MTKYTEKDVAEFIRTNYPRYAKATGLEQWVCWHMEQGFCLLSGRSDTGPITGLILARPVFHPEKMVGSIEFDNEGDTLFVDMAIALPPKRESLQALAFAVLNRFGQRSKLAFQRHGQGPVLVVDANAHRSKLLRTNYVSTRPS